MHVLIRKRKTHVSPLFENSMVDAGSYKQICVSRGQNTYYAFMYIALLICEIGWLLLEIQKTNG